MAREHPGEALCLADGRDLIGAWSQLDTNGAPSQVGAAAELPQSPCGVETPIIDDGNRKTVSCSKQRDPLAVQAFYGVAVQELSVTVDLQFNHLDRQGSMTTADEERAATLAATVGQAMLSLTPLQ